MLNVSFNCITHTVFRAASVGLSAEDWVSGSNV